MMKMKNMLFPLLIIMGAGSAPSMWALSGAERAKIRNQINKALNNNDIPLVDELIGKLRTGGEENLAAEYEARSVVAYANMALIGEDLRELAQLFIAKGAALGVPAPTTALYNGIAAELISVAAKQAQTSMEARKKLQAYARAIQELGEIVKFNINTAWGVNIETREGVGWAGLRPAEQNAFGDTWKLIENVLPRIP